MTVAFVLYMTSDNSLIDSILLIVNFNWCGSQDHTGKLDLAN